MNVGILTVSDRCSRGDAEDTSGDHLAATVPDKFGWNVSDRACLPDEREQIEKQLKYWADDRKLNLILTTGKNSRLLIPSIITIFAV